MCIVRAGNARSENQQRRRNMIQRQLLLQLVVNTLEERGGSRQNRPASSLRDACGERGRMLLGNAGVHIMRSGTFTEITGDAIRTRGGGGDDHQSRLVFETGLQRSHGHLTVVFARVKRLAERAVRILPMIRLALAGMRLRIGLVASVGTILRLGLIAETQALGGVDMQHDGMVDILQVFKRRDQRVHIVALLHITVVKSERLEQIQLRGSVRRAQTGKIAVHATEILGDRHLIVVDDDDEITALFGSVVQSFESDRRAQRTVADDGDDVADFACSRSGMLHITCFGKTAGKGDGRAGMAQHEGIMLAFQRIGETRHLAEPRLVQIRLGAPGKHLVHVALVGDIENETVTWRTEHAVQRHGKLHHAKIRTDVATMLPAVIQQRGTNLQTQITQLLRRKGMHIRRRMNRTQYASGHYAQLSFPEPVFFTAENPIPLYASAGVSVVKYLQSLLNCGTMETMK